MTRSSRTDQPAALLSIHSEKKQKRHLLIAYSSVRPEHVVNWNLSTLVYLISIYVQSYIKVVFTEFVHKGGFRVCVWGERCVQSEIWYVVMSPTTD